MDSLRLGEGIRTMDGGTDEDVRDGIVASSEVKSGILW